MRSLSGRYAALFAQPGVPRFVALSLLMRMPLGTVGLGTLLHVREITGSIAFAGSVVGSMLVAAAATAPIQGRLVDRHGPRGVLVATAIVAPLALAAILLARPLDLSRPQLLAAAVLGGAFSPPITVIVRTLLRARFAEGALRQSAFALDAVLLELAYTAGPLAIAAAVAAGSTTAAMAIALFFLGLAVPLLFVSGGLAWHRPETTVQRRPFGPLAETRLLRLYAATFALCTAFGALEVGYPGFARAVGQDAWGPLLIALNSIGSAIGGLVYGGLHLRRALPGQLPVAMALLAVPLVLHLPVASPWLLAPLAMAAGTLIAPSMTVVALLVSRYAPANSTTEAFTWSSTAIVTGVGAGMSAGGALVERFGANGAFGLAAAAALTGAVLALSLRRADG
jgi:predicted MFS family arabinose efflux permease